MVYWSWGSLSAFLLSENQGEKKMIFFSPKSAKVTELANLCVCFFLGACYYDANQSMYVFGGCTQSSCNAAFNDLWRLDLNSKEWIRPLASGERWQMFNSPTALSKLTLSVGLAGLILYFPACFIIIWLVFRLYPFFFFSFAADYVYPCACGTTLGCFSLEQLLSAGSCHAGWVTLTCSHKEPVLIGVVPKLRIFFNNFGSCHFRYFEEWRRHACAGCPQQLGEREKTGTFL